jgi:hypothetical protein
LELRVGAIVRPATVFVASRNRERGDALVAEINRGGGKAARYPTPFGD